jgi:N-acetyltransferase 10
MSVQELHIHLTQYDLKRLNLYSQNMVDYHLIMDLLPTIARLFFQGQIPVHQSAVQSVSQLLLLSISSLASITCI